MRIIHLTIQGEQLTADSRVAGQSGEHLATALSLAIPEDWQDCSCTLRFSLPSAGLYYRSGPLKSPILFPLPQALMVPGELKVFLDARKDFEVHRTSVLTLVVEESLDWCGGPLAADRYEGLLDMTLQEIGDALGKLEDLTDRLNEADALAASTQQAAEWAEEAAEKAEEVVEGFEGYTRQESDDRYAHALTGRASGDSVTLTDAQEGTLLLSLQACGKTTLSGTPASDAPASITGACTEGTVTITAGGQKIVLSCPTLYDLPDGTADTVDAVTGQTVTRIQVRVLDGTEAWYKSGGYSSPGVPAFGLQNASAFEPDDAQSLYCTHFTAASKPNGTAERIYLDRNLLIAVRSELLAEETAAGFQAWLAAQKAAGTPVTVLYPLYTPVETPGEGRAVPVPDGVISASGGAAVSVGYRKDTQKVIAGLLSRIEALEAQAVDTQIGG